MQPLGYVGAGEVESVPAQPRSGDPRCGLLGPPDRLAQPGRGALEQVIRLVVGPSEFDAEPGSLLIMTGDCVHRCVVSETRTHCVVQVTGDPGVAQQAVVFGQALVGHLADEIRPEDPVVVLDLEHFLLAQ